MRCPDCNKFVGLDEADPELDLSVEDAVVSGTVRIVRTCAECGQELKEASFDVEVDLSDDLTPIGEGESATYEGVEFDLVEEDAQMTSRTQTHDRNGKPIKNSRYMRSYYGAEVTVKVKATYPDGTERDAEGLWSDEVAAGEMEELV